MKSTKAWEILLSIGVRMDASCLGMSICGHTWNATWLSGSGIQASMIHVCVLYEDVDGVRAWRAELGRRGESFFGDGGQEGQRSCVHTCIWKSRVQKRVCIVDGELWEIKLRSQSTIETKRVREKTRVQKKKACNGESSQARYWAYSSHSLAGSLILIKAHLHCMYIGHSLWFIFNSTIFLYCSFGCN